MKAFLLFLALSFTVTVAMAGPSKTPPASEAEFQTQRSKIESEFGKRGRYSEITDKQRAEVISSLDKIAKILANTSNGKRLTEDLKAELFNQQENVNNILQNADELSEIKCTREITTGSHRKRTECMTMAERQRRRQDASRNMLTLGYIEPLPSE